MTITLTLNEEQEKRMKAIAEEWGYTPDDWGGMVRHLLERGIEEDEKVIALVKEVR